MKWLKWMEMQEGQTKQNKTNNNKKQDFLTPYIIDSICIVLKKKCHSVRCVLNNKNFKDAPLFYVTSLTICIDTPLTLTPCKACTLLPWLDYFRHTL